METVKFKFIASQARSIYHYKKLKIKVLITKVCTLINTICCKPDDGRIRPKHVASLPVVTICNRYLFVV